MILLENNKQKQTTTTSNKQHMTIKIVLQFRFGLFLLLIIPFDWQAAILLRFVDIDRIIIYRKEICNEGEKTIFSTEARRDEIREEKGTRGLC